MGIGDKTPSITVSVADLLDGVKDREGNPYVTDGQLNYANGVQ